MAVWKGLFRNVGNSLAQTIRRITSTSSQAANKGVGVARDTYSRIVETTGQVAEYTDDLYGRLRGVDKDTILDDCPIAAGILVRRTLFESDPDTFSLLYNVRVRPLLTATVVGAGGTGMLAFDEALSKVTRHIFDGDQLMGGWVQAKIASYIGEEKVRAINEWMDKVPGATVPGGGWIHRIQHGHDLEAVAEIGQDRGTEGVIQALYHIYGRDFFTPAGIPILPAGSEEIHKFLTSVL